MSSPPALRRVPLHDAHCATGAKMVPFADYEMPVQYASGVMKEHLHTRAAAGLFDVSHMGQIMVRPRSGNMADAALALERLVPADILALKARRQRYTFFTTPEAGVFDDLMIANFESAFLLIVNASRKEADEALLRAAREDGEDACDIEVLENRALLALQGPRSETVLYQLNPAVSSMNFMDAGLFSLLGHDCMVSRSGYTGEDGFEISVPAEGATALFETLLRNPDVKPVGLGARDSLRLEAGLCLYGNDLDIATSPIEADLTWSIQKSRRNGGSRAGGFPGAAIILDQIQSGVKRKRVGLKPQSRPVRAGARVFAGKDSSEPIGIVTSGGFGPSYGGPISMGYVDAGNSPVGSVLYAELREGRQPITVVDLPFVGHRYKR